MRAWVRTDRLTGLNFTTGDIIKAIEAQNVQAAVGRIGARPISNDQQLQLNIQTKGRLDSVKDFEKIVVRTNPDGSVLRLGDVARLELGASSLDRQTRFNGGPEAAIEGARLRFRPVMMTSFAFILGLLPLVVATGASQLARRNVGTPVFGGMIFASFIGIFVIPPLYVFFQSIREKVRPSTRPPAAPALPMPDAPPEVSAGKREG